LEFLECIIGQQQLKTAGPCKLFDQYIQSLRFELLFLNSLINLLILDLIIYQKLNILYLMNPFSAFKVIPILLLVFMTTVNTRVTIQTATPPIGSALLTFDDSKNDKRLIFSRRLENLELETLLEDNVTKTQFKLTSFKRGTSGNKDVYTLKLNGSWLHLKNSPDSLSCNLIH